MINFTCQQKMGLPLETVVKYCFKLEKSKELELIERHNKQATLRRDLQVMKAQCQLIIYSFKDLIDW